MFNARMELAVDQAMEAKSQVWDPQELFEYPNGNTYISNLYLLAIIAINFHYIKANVGRAYKQMLNNKTVILASLHNLISCLISVHSLLILFIKSFGRTLVLESSLKFEPSWTALGFHQTYFNLSSKDEWRSYRFIELQV